MITPVAHDIEIRHRKYCGEGLRHYGFDGMHFLWMPTSPGLPELGEVAQDVIRQSDPKPFCTVIGPISSGTPRSPELNLEIFNAIYQAAREGHGGYDGPRTFFYQLPFEFDIWRIREGLYPGKHQHEKFYDDLFKYFYGPVMNHPRLEAVILGPDYEKSEGAMIEYNLLKNRENKGLKPVVFYNALEHFPEIESLLK